MEQIVIENGQKIVELTPQQLLSSRNELSSSGRLMNSVPNKDVYNTLTDIIQKEGLETSPVRLFAINNNDKVRPGITISPELEEHLSKGHPGTFLFNRLMGQIKFEGIGNDECSPSVAFSFHQRGIEIVYGNNVHVCNNLSIYGGEHIRTYGDHDNNVSWNRMIEIFTFWLRTIKQRWERDTVITEMMKSITINDADVEAFIGDLTLRAYRKNVNVNEMAPLNVSQISKMAQPIVKESEYNEETNKYNYKLANVYELHNAITNVQKIDNVDLPLLFEQGNIGFKLLAARFINSNEIPHIDTIPKQ